MSRRPPGKNLSDLEAALAEYAQQQVEEHSRSLADVVAELVRGGCVGLSVEKLQGWMEVAGRAVVAEEDPFEGELDEVRRAEKMEVRLSEAAESVPGAADLLGLDRLRAAVAAASSDVGRDGEMGDVLVRALDFLVPELMEERVIIQATTVAIPKNGRWEVWDGGLRRVMASTLAIFDVEGQLVGLRLRTRPRGRVLTFKGGQILPVKTARLALKANLRGVAQRILQIAAEFRPERHGRISQLEMAEACDRTKQAISHQRRGVLQRVRVASSGRAGFRGIRNVRGKKP